MPETFYAELYCRDVDRHLFEEPSGFTLQDKNIPDYPNCVLLTDFLCTLTQIAEFPEDMPYFGSTESAQEWDATRFACDGHTYLEHNVSNDSECFFVRIDANGDPDPSQLAQVKEYVRHEKRAIELLKATTSELAQPTNYEDLLRSRATQYNTTPEVVRRATKAFWSDTDSQTESDCREAQDAGASTLQEFIKYFALKDKR